MNFFCRYLLQVHLLMESSTAMQPCSKSDNEKDEKEEEKEIKFIKEVYQLFNSKPAQMLKN